MRGRYMAVYGLAAAIPTTLGPGLAGLILDNFNPNLLWYLGGAICVVSALSFYGLQRWLGSQKRFAARAREYPPAETAQ
jgi:MFS family permease